jgi:hypothetical protein
MTSNLTDEWKGWGEFVCPPGNHCRFRQRPALSPESEMHQRHYDMKKNKLSKAYSKNSVEKKSVPDDISVQRVQ